MTAEDQAQVLELEVGSEQKAFVEPINETLADINPQRDNFVMEAEGTIIGFFQIDHPSDERKISDFLELHEVQIDAKHQGKGYGKAFVKELPNLLSREYPEAPGVCLTVNFRNTQAHRLYQLGGFIDTGKVYLLGRSGPQHIMRHRLRP